MFDTSATTGDAISQVLDLIKADKLEEAYKTIGDFQTLELVTLKAFTLLSMNKFALACEAASVTRTINDDTVAAKCINGFTMLATGNYQDAYLEFSDASEFVKQLSKPDAAEEMINIGKALSHAYRKLWTDAKDELGKNGQTPAFFTVQAAIAANMNDVQTMNHCVDQLKNLDPEGFIVTKLKECDDAFDSFKV